MGPPEEFEMVLRANLGMVADLPLDYGLPLQEYGLDSLAAVNIVVDLEEQFNVVFPDDRITHALFASAQTLWSTLSELVAANGIRPIETPK